MDLALPLVGLVLPFLFWAIEFVFPYPYLVEELGKAFFVVLVWRLPRRSTQIRITVLMAIFFAFSESVFYLFKLSFSGNLSLFLLRLLLTILLHVITSLIILLPTLKNRRLLLPGFFLAVVIHYLYNYLVTALL